MKIHHATVAKAKKFQITLTVEQGEIVATSKKGERLASGLQGNKVLEDAITKLTGKPAKGTPEGKAAAKTAPKPAKPVKVEDPYEVAAKDDGWKKTRWGYSKEGEESVQADSWQALCEDQGIEVETDEELDDDSDADQSKSIVKAKYKAKYRPHKDRSGDDLSHKVNAHVSRENDAGDMQVDKAALRAFATANDCWVPSYGSLVSRTGGWNGGMAIMNVNNRLRARLRRIAKEQDRPINIAKDVIWE